MTTQQKPPARILLVDDEIDIANSLRRGLEIVGFKVVTYATAPEALADLESHPDYFCALVSDIRMPQMSGLELARKAKSVSPALKIILMTAFEMHMTEFSDVLPSTRIDDLITKPFSIELLKQVLIKHVGDIKQLNT